MKIGNRTSTVVPGIMAFTSRDREPFAYSAGPNTASILAFSVAALNGLTM